MFVFYVAEWLLYNLGCHLIDVSAVVYLVPPVFSEF
jgi:hypothetical protein